MPVAMPSAPQLEDEPRERPAGTSVPGPVVSAWRAEIERGVTAAGAAAAAGDPGDSVSASPGPADPSSVARERLGDLVAIALPLAAGLALVAFVVRHADIETELTMLFVAAVGLLGGHLLMRARRQRRRAEDDARRATRELELRAQVADAEARRHRLAAFSEVAAQLAHEVRNPLSSIMLNAELLEDEVHACAHASPEVRRLATAVCSEAGRLSELTNEYLAFARLPRPDPAPQALAPLVDDVVAFMRGEIDRGSVAVDVRHEAPSMAVIDAKLMRQVLVNLLRNALDATPPGERLIVRTGAAPGRVTVDVIDSGPGVPAASGDAIFDPFYSTKPHGTGLGLAVARKIAREHGGDLVLRPSSRGAWFRLELPQAVPAEPPVM